MDRKSVSIEEAQTHLSHLIDELDTYDEIVITLDGVPAGRLVRPDAPKPVISSFGALKGQIWISDDFDDDDDDEMARLFGIID